MNRDGFLMIFFIEKRVERPALIKYVMRAILGAYLRIDPAHDPLCLQYGVFE
jgi:hypothetical protein